jgi:hypothetical protein
MISKNRYENILLKEIHGLTDMELSKATKRTGYFFGNHERAREI